MKTHPLALGIAILCTCWMTAFGQNLKLQQLLITSGGGSSLSDSYRTSNAIGELVIGLDSSTGYSMGSGFWYQHDAISGYYTTMLSISQGWNLISVPRTVSGYARNTIFPTSISGAFAFISTAGYMQRDTLENRIGYWLKFGEAQSIPVAGTPRTLDTIAVATGWNLIGSIAVPVDTGMIVQIPSGIVTSSYFGYSGGYFATGLIQPGQAYWVKTSSPGNLVLDGAVFAPLTAGRENESTTIDRLNVLSVEQGPKGTGHPLALLFGKGKDDSMSKYEMPPLPPEGALDVRFSSNRFVEFLGKEGKEVPLTIHSARTSLVISWKIKEADGLKYFLVEKNGDKVVAEHRLEGDGSLQIDPTNGRIYSLRTEEIPLTYQLYQNYPNPFNPATTMRFDLPEAATVTLTVYNILGQRVATPAHNQEMGEGQHTVEFDAGTIASGVYFYEISTQPLRAGRSFRDVKKMMVLK